jgi:hypothetical protein
MIFSGSVAAQEIYKCESENGTIILQDYPCKNNEVSYEIKSSNAEYYEIYTCFENGNKIFQDHPCSTDRATSTSNNKNYINLQNKERSNDLTVQSNTTDNYKNESKIQYDTITNDKNNVSGGVNYIKYFYIFLRFLLIILLIIGFKALFAFVKSIPEKNKNYKHKRIKDKRAGFRNLNRAISG